jgi:uncharacterized membrane protein
MSVASSVNSKLQHLISATLRTGVLAASITGILGGGIFLSLHGGQKISFHSFEGDKSPYVSPRSIAYQAFNVHGMHRENQALAIAQFGILLLLLTPVIRVVFSMIGFAMERDHTYVLITAIVLATLIGSFVLTRYTHP